MKIEKRDCAEESVQTRRAREKLQKRLSTFDRKVTKQALDSQKMKIHDLIARQASGRVSLGNKKSISLFDNNQNAAKVSSRVASLYEQLKTKS